MSATDLPQSFAACRQAFVDAVAGTTWDLRHEVIDALSESGDPFDIGVAVLRARSVARSVLVVLSGVHGVEAPIGSALQRDLVERLDPSTVPDHVGIVLVHVVNPWGLEHGRRQNRSNVDLNRNWGRSDRDPLDNDVYRQLHPFACPDDDELPVLESMIDHAGALIAEHGLDWLTDGLTRGQFEHADGLHYGGDRTQPSLRVVESVLAAEVVPSAERLLVVDLHTGVGPHGDMTLLSAAPAGSASDRFLRTAFGPVHPTIANDAAPSRAKVGAIGPGIVTALPEIEAHALTVEFGTVADLEQLEASYLEHWAHRHPHVDPELRASLTERYRRCFTPDDDRWMIASRALGGAMLDDAVRAVAAW